MANTLFFKVFYLLAVIALLAPNYANAARRDDVGHLGRTYGQLGVTKRLTNAQRLSRGLPLNKPVARRNGAIRARASATFSGSDSASATPSSSLIPLPPSSSAVSSSAPVSSIASSSVVSSSPISSIVIPPTSSIASSTPASSVASSSAPASSSAAATPVCTPNVGASQANRRFAIELGNSGSLSGYFVAASTGNDGIATVTMSVTQSQAFQFTPCTDSNVAISIIAIGAPNFPFFGAARAGTPANLGGSSIAYLTFVSIGPRYSPAVNLPNAWSNSAYVESYIWLADTATGKVTAQWVNADGSIVHVQTILTGQNQLALVEDFAAYHAIDPLAQLAVFHLN